MNLERVVYKDENYNKLLVLSKLSDFTNQYLCITLNFTEQKINTGKLVSALSFKTATSFRESRPFEILTEDQIVDGIKNSGGVLADYDVKLKMGDYIQFNGRKFCVLGTIVNTYAQWNLPTPLLFNTKEITQDVKMLYGSKFKDEEIVSKINDNFQSGKYNDDIAIPLIDGNDFGEEIHVVEPAPTNSEVNVLTKKLEAKSVKYINPVKNVFIDTIFESNIDEFEKIKNNDYDLFTKLQGLLNSVNVAVNQKIDTGKKRREKRVENVLVPVESGIKEQEGDLSFLDDIDSIIDVSFLEDIDNIIN